MAEKYIDDGRVGILYSPGYGAGWSTWGDSALAYDADLVRAFIEGGKDALSKVTAEKYPDAYQGGLEDIQLEWITQGSSFRINEYDGYESIEYGHRNSFMEA